MKNNKNSSGFTLVELLVAMAAFSIIVVSITGVAQSVIKSQRKAFALQNVQENTRYALESISKGIRMSSINSVDSAGLLVSILNTTNPDGDIISYRFDSNKIQRRIGVAGSWEDVSPSNVDLNGGFYIQIDGFPQRSLVTIIMKAESQGSRVESQAEINLQNTISSRSF